eukprot:TRINITY_DN191_c4_g1_i2.p1 TRINITY_DN191_c4_g1~~TRINITY_DN191_c4_g1_i2.p1  ORF type:complete len:581 (+),score=105.61 TRINITY_DN191_c4_g1_i2:52-1794(+)
MSLSKKRKQDIDNTSDYDVGVPSKKKKLNHNEEDSDQTCIDFQSEQLKDSPQQGIQWVISKDDESKIVGFRRNNVIYRVGECVYLSSDGDEPFIAQITSLYDDHVSCYSIVSWFYRSYDLPEDVLKSLCKTRKKKANPIEVFASRECDDNPIDSIERKCFVKARCDIKNLRSWTSEQDHYFYCFWFIGGKLQGKDGLLDDQIDTTTNENINPYLTNLYENILPPIQNKKESDHNDVLNSDVVLMQLSSDGSNYPKLRYVGSSTPKKDSTMDKQEDNKVEGIGTRSKSKNINRHHHDVVESEEEEEDPLKLIACKYFPNDELPEKESDTNSITTTTTTTNQASSLTNDDDCFSLPKYSKYYQPFKVKVDENALMIIDFHSHLVTNEVIGFLAGSWDPVEREIHIHMACPAVSCGDNELTVEIDPLSQLQIMQEIEESKMSVVGWYHSHTTFAPDPSIRDIENQSNYQVLFHCNKTHLEPFIGAIDATFDKRLPDGGVSVINWFWVQRGDDSDQMANKYFNQRGEAYKILYKRVRESTITTHTIKQMVYQQLEYRKEMVLNFKTFFQRETTTQTIYLQTVIV